MIGPFFQSFGLVTSVLSISTLGCDPCDIAWCATMLAPTLKYTGGQQVTAVLSCPVGQYHINLAALLYYLMN